MSVISHDPGPYYHVIHVQVFHEVAYKAKDRNDLIAGIDEFLDQVTVLPPGEWDPSIRIEPPKHVPSQVGLLLETTAECTTTVNYRRMHYYSKLPQNALLQ